MFFCVGKDTDTVMFIPLSVAIQQKSGLSQKSVQVESRAILHIPL